MLLANRYQLVEQIGVGGMGTVYHALDTRTNTPVAVKNLKPEVADHTMIERFQREGELLRQLNHPNIVKMLDAVHQNDQYYLVMEFVSGGSLADLLTAQKPLSIQQVIELALDLADALTRTHRLNVIHRDLKPANILIAEDGTPRLTDFGISWVRGTKITETGSIMGTLAYLSPESLQGEAVDHRSDIWAFGLILFEMVAGQFPFPDTAPVALIRAIANDPLPDLELLRPDAPLQLIDLIYRMLAKNPAERLPSVRLVGAELEALLQNRASPAPSLSFSTEEDRFATPTTYKHNLPNQPTPFVGREQELDELCQLLNDQTIRLVTIQAIGGMGKTRLSLEAAARTLDCFLHGVYFVPIAPLSDPSMIVQAIADALQFSFFGSEPPRDQLLSYLREKHLLLVLDNFEHLISGAQIVADIIQHTPQIKILATSRERLNLHGETIFTLDGMDFPDWETPQDALDYAAVQLLIQSIRRIRPDFTLQDSDLNDVARICRLALGMPLAIELAAAWIDSLSLSEIADEMQQNLDFLQSDLRNIPDRQRSVRAIFDYSWHLLSPAEQSVFKRLSVFRGGFTRQAGQSVSGASLRDLNSLVNKSLLKRDITSGRYQIHELLRQYAEEQLKQDSIEYERIFSQHCDYYADAMKKREADLKGEHELEALESIETDFENVRAAWEWAVQHQREKQLKQMAWSLMTLLLLRGRFVEACELFQKTLAQLTNENDTYGYMLICYAEALNSVGRWKPESDEIIHKGLLLLQQSSDKELIAFALRLRVLSLKWQSRREEALATAEEGVRLYKELDDQWSVGSALLTKTSLEWENNLEQVYSLTHEALQIYRQLKNKTGIANCLSNLSGVYSVKSDFEAAIQVAEEALNLQRVLIFKADTGISLHNLSFFSRALGRYEQADVYLQEAIRIFEDIGLRFHINLSRLDQAVLLALRGEHKQAHELLNSLHDFTTDIDFLETQGELAYLRAHYREALNWWQKRYEKLGGGTSPHLLTPIALAQTHLGELDVACQTLKTALSDAAEFTPSAILEIVRAFMLWLSKKHQYERAVELTTFVYTEKRALHEIKMEAQRLLADLETKLTPEQFAAAQERGKSLELNTDLINTVLGYLNA